MRGCEFRFGLSYAVSRTGYDRFLLPTDFRDGTIDEILPYLPEDLRMMPKWALCSMLGVSQLTGFGAGSSSGVKTTTFLTTTNAANQTWTVLADWNSSANHAQVVSHAGTASDGNGAGTAGAGGGGGGYAKALTISLTPSGSATYRLSAAGNGSDDATAAWFNGANLAASSAGIRGGANAATTTAGAGASTTNAIGSTKFAGGNGSDAGSDGGFPRGGGGGGAAGPSGAGGAANGAPPNTIGGTADNGTVAAGGWTAAGNSGTEFDPTHGCGSGAGGSNNNGQDGALYGGAGSGGGDAPAVAGASKQGIIVVTNNP